MTTPRGAERMVAALRHASPVAAAAVLMIAAGCDPHGPGPPAPLATPALVSGSSPYPVGCNPPAAGSGAVLFVGAEVEPSLGIDAADPHHLVAAWQQDRWRGGGANGIGSAVSFDGGRSWARHDPPFTTCAGGAAADGATTRASDPWVAILPGGVVLTLALALDNPWTSGRSAVVASRSSDGGRSWSAPTVVEGTDDPDLFLDKCSLTADPARPGYAWAAWDRLAGVTGPPALGTGPARVARTTDGGLSWEPPHDLYDPGPDAQTISSQLVVLPDGTLVDLLVVIRQASAVAPDVEVAALRSADDGASWDGPYTVSTWQSLGIFDAATGTRVRGGDIVPTVAVDRAKGTLYAAWQDGRFGGGVDGIAFSSSLDGGKTWSAPTRANADGSVPAFTPALAVAATGHVGLGYYDWRAPPPGSTPGLWTTRWLATSKDGGATWTEAADGGPFDLRHAPAVPGWFLGDYAGLVGGPTSFTSLFAMAGGGAGETDVFTGSPQP